jgi:hypothetical protein
MWCERLELGEESGLLVCLRQVRHSNRLERLLYAIIRTEIFNPTPNE